MPRGLHAYSTLSHPTSFMFVDLVLFLLTLALAIAPKALDDLKAKFKGLFSKKKKAETKPAETAKPTEAAKPTETTAPATTTEAAAPAPATAPTSKSEDSEKSCDSPTAYLTDADVKFPL